MVDLAGPVTRVAAEYRWDRSDSTGCGVTIGAFQVRSGGEAAVPSAVSGSRAHLGITPTALYFAVFAVGPLVDFTYLVPLDGTSARVPFPTAQIRDGRTIHRARIEIDGDTARVDVTGLPSPIYYREPRIRSTAASVPFWEYYSVTGATNLPRFTRVSASRR